MTINLDHLYILRTNIKTEADKLTVKNIFDQHDQIVQWNVDQQDIDCVLRIVSPTLCYETIIGIINNLGFEGAELQ